MKLTFRLRLAKSLTETYPSVTTFFCYNEIV